MLRREPQACPRVSSDALCPAMTMSEVNHGVVGTGERQRVAKSLRTLYEQINALAPHRNTRDDGTIGDARHRARKSDHNPDARGIVRALDVTHDPAHGCDAGKIAEALRLSQDARIKYVIWARRIFYAAGTQPYRWQR